MDERLYLQNTEQSKFSALQNTEQFKFVQQFKSFKQLKFSSNLNFLNKVASVNLSNLNYLMTSSL